MTDLTLHEYDGVAEEKLVQILQAEAIKMFAFDSLEYDYREEGVNRDPLSQFNGKGIVFISRYWTKMSSLIRHRRKRFHSPEVVVK